MNFRKTFLVSVAFSVSAIAAVAAPITVAEPSQQGGWYCFRGTILLDKELRNPCINIDADSKYWLWINGELQIAEGGLKQGPSPTGRYYDKIDGAAGLHSGTNSVAVLVWWFGKSSFSHRTTPAVRLDVSVCNGADTVAVSDCRWHGVRSRAFYVPEGEVPNYRLSESNVGYDARYAMLGWTAADFDDTAWNPTVVAEPCPEITHYVERPVPFWRDYGLCDYTKVERSGNRIIATLPYNCHAMPYISLTATVEGAVVDIRTDDYMGGSEPNVRGEYRTRVGEQSYESPAWLNGHKVIYTLPDGVENVVVKYRQTGYDCDLRGEFECDDEALNTLWHKAQRTLYVTMRDTYMDCPDRERAQWWGDVVNELGETFYALDRRSDMLTRKAVRELAAYQRTDNTIFSPVPSGTWHKELPMQMLASVGYYGFWNYYFCSGDRATIESVYPAVKRYIKDVWNVDARGLVIPRKGGWTWGDWGANKDMEPLFSAWYAIALDGYGRMSALLGYSDEAQWAAHTAARLKRAFNDTYWRGKFYRSADYRGATDDRVQALAVVSGIMPESEYAAARQFFAENHHASPYMEKYVLEALCRMGYAQDAMERMKLRFAKMIESPLSTLWEGWDIGSREWGGGSYNHAWSGGPLTILSQYVAGVSPTSEAFRTFSVRPEMGELRRLHSLTPTHYGDIVVDAHRTDTELHISLVVPRGTTAEVELPRDYKALRVGKRTVQSVKLGSGSHTITAVR